MRKSMKYLGGLAVAGVIAGGGAAFTASNTVPASVAGYGVSTVTGAVVTSVKYTNATDPSELASVVFTSSTDVTNQTAVMSLRDTGGAVVGTPYSCVLGTYTAGAMTITCDTNDNPLYTSFVGTGLTVTDATP